VRPQEPQGRSPFGNGWSGYCTFVQALPPWRIVVTVAMVVALDVWVIVGHAGLFLTGMAPLVTLLAAVLLIARWVSPQR
jgi:hypothetical protein